MDLSRSPSPEPMVERFRALIVGRANAGKTTILKSICESKDDPRVYNANGKEVRHLLFGVRFTHARDD